MRIAVVIPARNAESTLPHCLDALAESTFHDYDCVVVDDGSVDSTAEVAESRGVAVVRGERPLGPAACRNRGAAAATGSILLFLDADVCVRPDTLTRVAGWFAADPDLDGVFGSYDDAPTGSIVSRYRNLLHHFGHQTGSPRAQTFWAGCGGLRRETFVRAGGFNEGFSRPSVEDVELGYRITDAGGRIRLDRDLLVRHLKQWTIAGILYTDIMRRALPWGRLMRRRASVPADLNLAWRARLSGGLTWVALAGFAAAIIAVIGDRDGALPATAAVLALAGVAALNRSFYRLLFRVGGLPLLAGSIPLHLAYYAYSVVAFLWAAVTPGRLPAGQAIATEGTETR